MRHSHRPVATSPRRRRTSCSPHLSISKGAAAHRGHEGSVQARSAARSACSPPAMWCAGRRRRKPRTTTSTTRCDGGHRQRRPLHGCRRRNSPSRMTRRPTACIASGLPAAPAPIRWSARRPYRRGDGADQRSRLCRHDGFVRQLQGRTAVFHRSVLPLLREAGLRRSSGDLPRADGVAPHERCFRWRVSTQLDEPGSSRAHAPSSLRCTLLVAVRGKALTKAM